MACPRIEAYLLGELRSNFSKRALFWTPRALSIAFIAFLSLFALDVFDEHLGFWQTALALTVHLIPMFALIAVLVLAWQWEWIGAALFAAAGLLYVTWLVFIVAPRAPGNETDLDSFYRWSGLCYRWVVSGQLAETGRTARPRTLGCAAILRKAECEITSSGLAFYWSAEYR
jgi:hypothetical protein